ncbi:MAG: DnaD domain protein [Eubacteriales bacterium]|nr:DnaD domain protein [Eubacteriales bacterium]
MFDLDEQAKIFGITAVENLFFTEYLPDASGDQVKVYLWGLYQSQRGAKDYTLKQMSRDLGLEEAQVEAALRYWERRRLVERVSDKPLSYVYHSLCQHVLTGQDGIAGDLAFILFNDAVYAQFDGRRKLRPNGIALAYEWVQDLGLPQEVVLMLLNHCADTRGSNFSFKSAQALAVAMREDGVMTPEEAENYLSHSKRTHQGARAVLGQFNLRRLPTEPELALYRKWTLEWGFDESSIIAACQETVSANHPSFSYLDRILDRLRRQGGTSAREVRGKLEEDNRDAEHLKQVLDILGVGSQHTFTVLPAYRALREDYSHEMILLAARSVQSRRGAFEDLEPKLMSWKSLNLMDESQVREHLTQLKAFQPAMFAVFELSGQEGRPGEQDLMHYRAWREAGHSDEVIREAASQARSSKRKLSYIGKVLETWKKEGITTPQAARDKAPWASSQGGKKVSAQLYRQRENTEEDYASDIDWLEIARKESGQ